jgi:hypothetical protein
MAVHCCTRTARPCPSNRCSPREAGAGRRVTAGHHRPTGSGDGGQASARRARRASARQGAALADAPARTVPVIPPLRLSPWWSTSNRSLAP